MKKKIAILSAVAAITPISLVVTGCSISTTVNKNITNAQLFTEQYSTISYSLDINNIEEFINQLELGYKNITANEGDYTFLAKLWTSLGIYMNLKQIFVLNDSVKIENDTLKFVFVNDNNSVFNGEYLVPSKNAIYYNVSLENINNQSTLFKKYPEKSSELFKNTDLISNTQNIYSSSNNSDNLVSVGDSNYKYFYDSEIVNNLIKDSYNKVYSSNNINDYSKLFLSDLNLSLKEMINNNIDSWNQYLYNSDLFISVQNNQKTKSNTISPIVYLQIKNSGEETKEFNFFNLKINIPSNTYLSLKAELSFDFNNPSLSINEESYVGYLIKNPTISYELSNSNKIINSNLSLMLNKAKSINTKINNISFSDSNPYNKEINNILESELSNLTLNDVKGIVEQVLVDKFNDSKQLAIANFSWMNAFNVDPIKNPNYSFYDAIIKISESIKTIYQNSEYSQYSEIISSLFSNMPIYQFFYNIFDDLMSLLSSNASLNAIYNFLYDNLTIDGTKKSLKEFHSFFANIKNLSPIIARLIGVNLEPYVVSYIILLVDALSDPEQTLWLFISNNLGYILNILQALVPSISNQVESLKNVKIYYKNNLVKNILTDIPLYDFLSANNVRTENPISISSLIIGLLADLKGTLNLLLTVGNIPGLNLPIDINQLKPILKLIQPIIPIIQLLVNGVLSCITGQSVKSYTAIQYQNYFKNKLTILDVNNNDVNILDYLNKESNYKISNFSWNNEANLDKNCLNAELKFDLLFEDATKQSDSISNITYKLIFNNSPITPFFNSNKEEFSWYLSSYYSMNTSIKSDDLITELALDNTASANYIINSNQKINNLDNYSNNYIDDVIYPEHQFQSINKLELSFDYKSLKPIDIPAININLADRTYYELNSQQYFEIIDALNKINTNSNLDFLTLRPKIQLFSTKILGRISYRLVILFPINVYIGESFTNTLTISNLVVSSKI